MEDKISTWLKEIGAKRQPDEFDSKKLINLYDIKTPQSRLIKPGEPLNFEGILPPFVLKVCSCEILHKTEFQGVMLNIDQSCIGDCFNQMRQRFKDMPIMIENQMSYTGPEFIIGTINDPAMGHAVMVGAGGIFTEIYRDTSFRLAPCNRDDALDMIDELTLAPVFDNFRGMSLDKEKLAVTISQISKLAHDMGNRINQLDINPIVFSGLDWVALDVKILF